MDHGLGIRAVIEPMFHEDSGYGNGNCKGQPQEAQLVMACEEREGVE